MEHEEHEETLFDIMFGLDHVISEIFWNVAFLVIGYVISRIFAWRRIHKYIDNKHGVTHEKDGY